MPYGRSFIKKTGVFASGFMPTQATGFAMYSAGFESRRSPLAEKRFSS
ncbi:hypothetical protein [Flavihumibacter sp. ZG627]|nr:hypothetical protein [Flavihumibacter sp. ZG627]